MEDRTPSRSLPVIRSSTSQTICRALPSGKRRFRQLRHCRYTAHQLPGASGGGSGSPCEQSLAAIAATLIGSTAHQLVLRLRPWRAYSRRRRSRSSARSMTRVLPGRVPKQHRPARASTPQAVIGGVLVRGRAPAARCYGGWPSPSRLISKAHCPVSPSTDRLSFMVDRRAPLAAGPQPRCRPDRCERRCHARCDAARPVLVSASLRTRKMGRPSFPWMPLSWICGRSLMVALVGGRGDGRAHIPTPGGRAG